MHTELTNLLPEKAIRRLRHSYFMRLVVVGTLLGTFLVVAHGLLLVPSYLYASAQARREAQELERLSAAVGSAEEAQVRDRVATLREDITHLAGLRNAHTGSTALRAILSAPRAGIQLQGFTIEAAAATSSRMTVSGTAATRDSLRQFVGALERLPGIESADLPISAYAKESAIPFTISLAGTPTL